MCTLPNLPLPDLESVTAHALLEKIDSKLDVLLEKANLTQFNGSGMLDAETLLHLPRHLCQTAMVVLKEGAVTAEQVAEKTGKCRSDESSYLNTIVTMGLLEKSRVNPNHPAPKSLAPINKKGRVRVYFSVARCNKQSTT
jgi:hypothetical protein